MRFTTFDLHQLLAAAVERFAHEAREKGVTVASGLGAGLPQKVFGDVDGLSERLAKLIGHAIHVTERGQVVVSVQHDLGNRFRFAVAHTGKGMTPEDSLRFVASTCRDMGVHTAPDAGSTVWFFAQLDPAEATAGA